MKKIILSVLSIFLLASCAANGPVFKKEAVADNDSMLYIYRPNNMVNCCVAPNVEINGINQGPLKNGGYLFFKLPAGKHKIKIANKSAGFYELSLELELKAGEEYYAKWSVGDLESVDFMLRTSKYSYNLASVDNSKAISEISSLKYSGSLQNR